MFCYKNWLGFQMLLQKFIYLPYEERMSKYVQFREKNKIVTA